MSGGKGFGRDEMTALVGDGLLRNEALLRPTTQQQRKNHGPPLTAHETQREIVKVRHRTGKVRQYHQLLAEQITTSIDPSKQQWQQTGQTPDTDAQLQPTTTDKDERTTTKRTKRYDTSSSSSSSVQDSSESDDEANEQRRQWLIRKRKQAQQKEETLTLLRERESSNNITTTTIHNQETPQTTATTTTTNNHLPSPPQSSSSSSSSSEDTSEESSDAPESPITRPTFVPKRQRHLETIKAREQSEEEQKIQKQQAWQQQQSKQSRIILQQVLTQKQTGGNETNMIQGALNDMPDDTEPTNARELWEVRELTRLLAELEPQTSNVKEQELPTGPTRGEAKEEQKFLQRYYHRGAFYMDESEWDRNDIRHKAADYAKAATGEDKINKSALPKVMQVKKFGFANQNMRYKGLAAEDTTDRSVKILPLVNDKKKNAK